MAKRKPINPDLITIDDNANQTTDVAGISAGSRKRRPINLDLIDIGTPETETEVKPIQSEITKPEPTQKEIGLTEPTIGPGKELDTSGQGILKDVTDFLGITDTPEEKAAKNYRTLIRMRDQGIMTPTKAEKSFRTPGENIAGSFGQGFVSTAQGLARAGEAVGLEFAKPVADNLEKLSNYLAPNEMDFMLQTISGAGSLASFYLPGLGVMKGASLLAKLTPSLAKWAAAGASGALEAATESGFTYDEVLKKTGDKNKAQKAAAKTFGMNAILVPLTDRFGIFGDAKKAWKAAIGGMTNEGIQEASQEIISALAADRDIKWKDVFESGLIGAILGGGTAAGLSRNDIPDDLLKELKIDPKSLDDFVRTLQDPRTGEQLKVIPKAEAPKTEAPKTNEQSKGIIPDAEQQTSDLPTLSEAEIKRIKGKRAFEIRQKQRAVKKADTDNLQELTRQFKNTRRKRKAFDIGETKKIINDMEDPGIKVQAKELLNEIERHNKKLTDKNELTLENLSKKKFRKNLNELSDKRQQEILSEYNFLKLEGKNQITDTEIIAPKLKGKKNNASTIRSNQEITPETTSKLDIETNKNSGSEDLQFKQEGEKGSGTQELRGEEGQSKKPIENVELPQPTKATDDLKIETNPSEAQKEAGNYKKQHIKRDGFDITIENPKDTFRSGTDKDGETWKIKMNNTYGYIKGTVGKDKDHLDVFLADDYAEGDSKPVYIVNQTTPDGKFDEHKVMMGFDSPEAAQKAYEANYNKGAAHFSDIVPMDLEQFKVWSKDQKLTSKPAITKVAKTDLDIYIDKVKSMKKSGIEITEEAQIEETGEIVKIKSDASEVLREADRRISAYQELLDCI